MPDYGPYHIEGQETECPQGGQARQHCLHWYDGEPCCRCEGPVTGHPFQPTKGSSSNYWNCHAQVENCGPDGFCDRKEADHIEITGIPT